MRQLKKASCALLAVLLVFSLGGFAVFDVHALVLDPVAWLYPIWQMYGAQAGVTVSTMGGDEFTQQGFTSLFDEWQQSEVASGLSSAVQTIGQFVDSVREFVDIGAGSTSGGTLWSKLRLAAGITSKLARFWNWIIVDKLGGSSVDSVDFDTSSGNLSLSTSVAFRLTSELKFMGQASNRYYYSRNKSDIPIYGVWCKNINWYGPLLVSDVRFSASDIDHYYLTNNTGDPYNPGDLFIEFNSTYSVWYVMGYWDLPDHGPASGVPYYSSLDSAFAAISGAINSGTIDGAGSLTVAPDVGVDVLGFPDTSDPAYVPSDAVIPWNIPYDQTKDTNDYLDEAYEKALDNELTDQPDISNPPVEGSGTVEDVGAYVVPGLGDVFPFCIPFDIYDFLSALASDPVAPHFTANLDFPDPIGTQTIDLDFDTPTFNQLAQLLRLLELLAFIVGLAFITRSMIIRG